MSEYLIPTGVCRFCAGPEHASGTMCSMHPDLITERMAPFAFTGDIEDYGVRVKGLPQPATERSQLEIKPNDE